MPERRHVRPNVAIPETDTGHGRNRRVTRPISETTVTIRGMAYQIRSDADPAHLEKLAEHVDGTMKALEGTGGALSPGRLAVLASLTIADELYRERESKSTLDGSMRARLHRIESALDEALADG
jgi:cell division protein ZapA (FtsZ GTPase activity inhibitor)